MPRTKVKIAFVEDFRKRKRTYTKRKTCLKKQLEELSMLCGVEAGLIMYSPFESQVEVWPEEKIKNVLDEFRSQSIVERSTYMMGQDSYIEERMRKVTKKINKQMKENHEMVIENMLSGYLSGKVCLDAVSKTDLDEFVDKRLEEVDKRIELLKIQAHVAPSPPPQPQAQTIATGGSGASQTVGTMMILHGSHGIV